MGCAYAPSGQAVACGGLDNKLTVFPLSLEDDSSARKKVVGTHTSYTSCCLFPGSDNQVSVVQHFAARWRAETKKNCSLSVF
jgi:guanine nucleotide-binding protein subunit beta-5